MKTKYIIKNIERGIGERNKFIYAKLCDADTGEVMISATLGYICEQMYAFHLPEEEDADNED